MSALARLASASRGAARLSTPSSGATRLYGVGGWRLVHREWAVGAGRDERPLAHLAAASLRDGFVEPPRVRRARHEMQRLAPTVERIKRHHDDIVRIAARDDCDVGILNDAIEHFFEVTAGFGEVDGAHRVSGLVRKDVQV